MLSHLSTVADPGEDAWIARFYELRSVPLTYYTIVIVDMRTDRIVATGTIYIERKFIRGLGAVGHFEDVAVGRLQQGRQLGLCIAKALVEISEGMGCYKTTGDCLDRNIRTYTYPMAHLIKLADKRVQAFYEKVGGKRVGCMMVRSSSVPMYRPSLCPDILRSLG